MVSEFTLAIHVQVCSGAEELQVLQPASCQEHLQPDNLRPFSLKHAQQQASIVGHMQQAGLLQVANPPFWQLGKTESLLCIFVLVLAAATLHVLCWDLDTV